MPRTFDEIVASGDATIIHPGVNWGISLNNVLADEDFEVVWKRCLDNQRGCPTPNKEQTK